MRQARRAFTTTAQKDEDRKKVTKLVSLGRPCELHLRSPIPGVQSRYVASEMLKAPRRGEGASLENRGARKNRRTTPARLDQVLHEHLDGSATWVLRRGAGNESKQLPARRMLTVQRGYPSWSARTPGLRSCRKTSASLLRPARWCTLASGHWPSRVRHVESALRRLSSRFGRQLGSAGEIVRRHRLSLFAPSQVGASC